MSEIESVVSLSAQEMKEIFGQLDENVKKIEKALFVKIIGKSKKDPGRSGEPRS